MNTDPTVLSEAVEESPQDQAYRQARERAEMVQGLYIHSLVFVVINAGLFAVNWLTRSDNGSWWFQWPLLIWGTGLIVHLLVTVAPVFSPEWAERRAQQILAKRG